MKKYENVHADRDGMWGGHNPAPHNTVFNYTTTHNPEAVLSENYFNSVRDFFSRGNVPPGENQYQAGDEIRVMCYLSDGSWMKCRVEVRFVDDHKCVVEQTEPWRSGGGEPALDLTAEYVGFGGGGKPGYNVLYKNTGKLFRRGVSEAEAERLTGKKLGKKAKADAA